MDKQLLDALNNIGNALDLLVEALQNREEAKSATGTALKSGDFGKQLETISAQIKSIKADTQTIIKNQQTIIALSKQKEADKKTDEFEGASDPKKENAIKKGVGTILLIAVAVLAIGMAFKLVGDVNVIAVIGLALGITIIAIAFEKVASLKLGLKEAAIASLTIVMISAALTVSSWFLTMITPISFIQALTGVMIGIMFGAVAIGLGKMLDAFSKIGVTSLVKSVIFLPLILPAIALGITLASFALQFIKPIGLAQFFGAIMVGLVFVVLAFGLKKIISAFQGIDPVTAVVASFMIPILFTAMSVAIWASSELLSLVKPISFIQFLVSLAIAIIFIPISYAIAPILSSIGKMKFGDLFKLPIFFTLVSLAIMISSHILSYTADLGFVQLLKIALLGITLALIVTIMSLPIAIVGKIGIKDILTGSLGIILVAGAIMVSSHILALGNYEKYPDWKWALGVGLSIIAFTPAIVALGIIAMSGVGALAILAGAGMVLVVAGTIMATSHILKKGDYSKYPTLGWSLGTSLALAAFATGMTVLGGIIVGTFGLGGVMLAAGSAAVLTVAKTIVAASDILAKGFTDSDGNKVVPNWKDGPTLSWSRGVAMALGAFSSVYRMMMGNKIMSIFGGGGVGPVEFTEAIKTVSKGIVVAAAELSQGNIWKGGPTKEWAEGVSLALGAFSPVYAMMMKSNLFSMLGGGDVGPEAFTSAIKVVSQGIVSAAEFFAANKAKFDGTYPSKEWGEGVGSALGAFAPIFDMLMKKSGFWKSGDSVIKTMMKGVISSAQTMVRVAKILHNGSDYFTTSIDPNYIKSVSKNMLDFNNLVQELTKSEGDKGFLSKLGDSMLGTDPISQIARRMVTLAEGYDRLASSLTRLGSAMKDLNVSSMKELGGLTTEIASAKVSPKALNENLSKIEGSKSPTVTGGGLSTQPKIGTGQEMLLKKVDKMIELLTNIDKSSSSLNDFMQGNEDTSASVTNIKS
jgi:hypothetical protein